MKHQMMPINIFGEYVYEDSSWLVYYSCVCVCNGVVYLNIMIGNAMLG